MNGILKHPTKMSARHHQTKMMEPRVGEEGGGGQGGTLDFTDT